MPLSFRKAPQPSAWRSRILLLAGALIVAGGLYYLLSARSESTDDASIDAHVVPIAAKLAGYVAAVNVNDNQEVKAGDVLLTIGATDFAIRLDQAKAALLQAEAKLAEAGHSLRSTRVSAPSGEASARAQVESAKAKWENAAADLRRYQSMSKEARSQQQLDAAVAAEAAARGAYADAQARLKSAETAPYTVASAQSSVHALQAAVDKAKADVAQAEDDLAHTSVVAPISGHVAQKTVEKGAYVQPGEPLMAIVGDEVWVVANFKEGQLTHMQPGQAARIRIDAYPGKTYKGKVESIQSGTGARFSLFPPENATGNYVKVVQRVPVKIVFEEKPDAALAIGPGMSVVPTVYTGR